MFRFLAQNKIINKFLALFVSAIYSFSYSRKREKKNGIKNIYWNKQRQKLYKLIENKYKDYYCIFSNRGVGDIFFVASLIKEFKEKNRCKVVYFTEKKSIADFLTSFPSIDKIVFDKNIDFLQNTQILQKSVQKGKLNIFSFPYRGNKQTYTFSDNYNNLFNLSLNIQREIPLINDVNKKNAEKEFKKLKVTSQKTVLIIPDAVMFDYRTIDSSFWKNLAEYLEERSYNVVFNTRLKEYKKFRNTFLPIMDFVAFAKQSKYIISIRSGMTDLLVGMGINNLTAIYPQNLEVIWADRKEFNEIHKQHVKLFDTEFENIFNIYSLNTIFKRNDVNEIIYNYNDKEIIENIIKQIEKI